MRASAVQTSALFSALVCISRARPLSQRNGLEFSSFLTSKTDAASLAPHSATLVVATTPCHSTPSAVANPALRGRDDALAALSVDDDVGALAGQLEDALARLHTHYVSSSLTRQATEASHVRRTTELDALLGNFKGILDKLLHKPPPSTTSAGATAGTSSSTHAARGLPLDPGALLDGLGGFLGKLLHPDAQTTSAPAPPSPPTAQAYAARDLPLVGGLLGGLPLIGGVLGHLTAPITSTPAPSIAAQVYTARELPIVGDLLSGLPLVGGLPFVGGLLGHPAAPTTSAPRAPPSIAAQEHAARDLPIVGGLLGGLPLVGGLSLVGGLFSHPAAPTISGPPTPSSLSAQAHAARDLPLVGELLGGLPLVGGVLGHHSESSTPAPSRASAVRAAQDDTLYDNDARSSASSNSALPTRTLGGAAASAAVPSNDPALAKRGVELSALLGMLKLVARDVLDASAPRSLSPEKGDATTRQHERRGLELSAIIAELNEVLGSFLEGLDL